MNISEVIKKDTMMGNMIYKAVKNNAMEIYHLGIFLLGMLFAFTIIEIFRKNK